MRLASVHICWLHSKSWLTLPQAPPPPVRRRRFFGNAVEEPLTSIKTAWRNTWRRADVHDLHCHDLRRAFASQLFELSAYCTTSTDPRERRSPTTDTPTMQRSGRRCRPGRGGSTISSSGRSQWPSHSGQQIPDGAWGDGPLKGTARMHCVEVSASVCLSRANGRSCDQNTEPMLGCPD